MMNAVGDDSMAAIWVEGLVKEFPGDVRALTGISFEVQRGEIFAYLGRNGSGKSTTVRILTTLTAPTSGRAEVLGYPVDEAPDEVRRRIGATMQETALDPEMTGREHLLLAGGLWGLDRKQRRLRTAELLEFFALGDAADRRVSSYSGGMKRRLDLAHALITRPQVLFLDEPTTGLDPQSRRALWGEIVLLRDAGATVFLTTQHLEEAEALVDHLVIIDAGRAVARGTVDDLKSQYGRPTVEFRVSPGEVPALGAAGDWLVREDGSVSVPLENGPDGSASQVIALASRLHAADVSVLEFDVQEPSLEDIFVELTGSAIEPGLETPA